MLPLAWLLFQALFSLVDCDLLQIVDHRKSQCNFTLTNGNYENFLTTIPLFENCTRKFKNPSLIIRLRNCIMPGFPNNTFNNLPQLDSFILQISAGSKISLLSPLLPHYVVFNRMKFKRALFDIRDAANLIGWNWDVLSEIENESIVTFQFNVIGSKIIRLSSNFNKIANGYLTDIRIINCQLRWLEKNVFGSFSNLGTLELSHNLIEKFERSHLPINAAKLTFIDLSENRLQYLPANIFTDLPHLKALDVEGNNIKVSITEIETILAAKSLLNLDGIIWPCDCCKLLTLSKKLKISDEKCYTDEEMEISFFLTKCKITERCEQL